MWKTRMWSLAVVSLLVVFIATGCTVSPPEVASAPEAEPAAAEQVVQMPEPPADPPGTYLEGLHIESGGIERTYNLYIPSGYDESQPHPLVLNLHCIDGSIGRQTGGVDWGSRMTSIAEEEGFIVAEPAGIDAAWNVGACFGRKETWTANEACPPPDEPQADDVRFISDLIDSVSEDYHIDPLRVYSMGFSLGGHMSYRLACELSDRIAAIGSVAGLVAVPACEPTRPVPVIQIHGTADADQIFASQEGAADTDSGVVAMVDAWADRNGCPGETEVVYSNGDVTCTAYTDCQDEATVQLCVVDGGGHTWPGGYDLSALFQMDLGPTSQDMDASQAIWDFFEQHPMAMEQPQASGTGYAEVNGTRLYYEMAGQGESVVLLHGLGGDARAWDYSFDALAAYYQVIRYDLRGYGRSDVPADQPYSHEDDLQALLDYLGIEKAHIVGQSFGGEQALNFVLAYPDSALSLVSVAGDVAGAEGLPEPTPEELQALGAMIEALQKGDIEGAAEACLLLPGFALAREAPELHASLVQVFSEYSWWHMANADPVRVSEVPAAQRLGEVYVPTMYIIGDHDTDTQRATGDLFAAGIPQARLVVMEGTDHVCFMEKPEEFNEILLSFLAEASATLESNPAAMPSVGQPTSPLAYGIGLEPLAELEGYCSSIVVGPSTWGVRMVSPISDGTLTGPRLFGKFLPVGGDFMLVRADGCFEQDARVVIETDDGATIYSAYQGVSAMTQEQLEQLTAGEVPEGLVFYTTLRFETAHPDYQWLTRIQAVGMGSIEGAGDLVKWRWSWYELTADPGTTGVVSGGSSTD